LKNLLKLFGTILVSSVVLSAYPVKAKDYQKVTSKPGVTIVEFWAPWCGNCAAFKPAYNSAKRKFNSSIRFVEINTDEVDDSESTFGLKYGLPTLVMFKDGVEISRLPGGGDMQEVVNWINSNK